MSKALESHMRARAEHVAGLGALVRSTSARRLTAFGLSPVDGTPSITKLRRNAYGTAIGDLSAEDLLIIMAWAVRDATDHELVFSNDTSCAVWQLPSIGARSRRVEYVVRPGTRGRTPNVRRRRTSLPTEAVDIGGLLVTPYERTVVDDARHALLESGVSVCDDALHRSLTSREALLGELAKVPRGRRGRRMAQLAIHLADERAESPLESLSRTRMFQCGLPMPELQKKFFDGAGFIGRTDFYWPALGLVGESDGDLKYTFPEDDSGESAVDALLQEKKREQRLRRHHEVEDIARWDWSEGLPHGALHGVLGAHGVRPVLDGGWPVPDGPLPPRAFPAERLRQTSRGSENHR
ncbi:hypothetical protein GCM10011492_36460 [Flexivirga endophytica]|uniref:AbiEi antitoxin C-terminal domain-containing protein n=1 Tax=Flexivirga endophytica TaxID=1849103 RepID=A0A916TEQ3_9MICO|nr:hypothetical protein GCM10011492_36460 [Flexivirga endophytica]GHB70398.1 hypothetical protein GCM10008112_43570 [Flexivirga endophytica]